MSRGERWGAGPEAAGAARRARAAAAAVSEREPPRGHVAAVPGAYDHAFAAEARLDVPGDGAWHNVAPSPAPARSRSTTSRCPRWLRVYRSLRSPARSTPRSWPGRSTSTIAASSWSAPSWRRPRPAAPSSSASASTPRSRPRATRAREEAAGVLRGALKLVHEVTITVENLAPRAIQLEVREACAPGAGRGGRRGRGRPRGAELGAVAPQSPSRAAPARRRAPLAPRIPAGARRDLQLDYHVRIAGRHELVGGNRREP
ncbi:MAG: hypothetical protein HS111_37240 [Kofleriaceae bacterium]|nr:hypothetical protein [Kofleriaceae bacterium]